MRLRGLAGALLTMQNVKQFKGTERIIILQATTTTTTNDNKFEDNECKYDEQQ